MTRQTQEVRRQKTIGKLLDATIASLSEAGYASTSISAICKRAGVSQGALFNYFDTRLDIVVAATEHICRQHIDSFDQAASVAADLDGDLIERIVHFVRDTSRTARHAAWHEVMVAARTDAGLRSRVSPSLERFERALLDTAQRALELDDAETARVGVVVLSVMHMFDSESVTVAVFPNPNLEKARIVWAADLLRDALAPL